MMRPTLFTAAVLLSAAVSTVHAAVFNCVGGSIYAVAHPDDDLLFQSPTLLDDVDSGECITSIFLSSGDSGAGSGYARSREVGNQAAYSQMFGVNNTWTEFYATFGGQPVLVRTLVAKPQHQAVFFRLPDGGWDTGGFASTGFQTLRKLYFGSISTITNQPGDATYTLATLKQAISQIIAARQPSRVRTLDYLSDFGGGDHDDHLATGRLVKDLVGSASVSGYMGYPVQNLAPTLSTTSTAFKRKTDAFFAYTPYDSAECQSLTACASRGEASWLQREYAVTSALATKSSTSSPQTPVVVPSTPNLAPLAVATSSSNEAGSIPFAAIDGVIAGYPGNESAEWASDHQGAGAWLKLTWNQPVSISTVVLYDRPNSADWLQAGTLTASDGSSISFTNTVNDGSPFVIQLPVTVTTTSLLVTVTQVSSTTASVGLSEIQVYGGVSSTSTSTSSAPASTASGTTSPSGNLAVGATASASSWAAATNQTPDKAIDGVVNGYKADGTGDYTKEWASDHQGAGATLGLQWTTPVTANQVVLFDRLNLDDQITSGTIAFSDGSSVSVPALNNAGGATAVAFTARTFTSLVFTVNSVSNTTSNVGLAEIQVFLASASTASATSAVPATSSAIAASSSSAASTSTAAPPSSTGSSSLDLALNATASASTWNDATSQTPDKAIDGVVSGYKENGSGDYTKEWASDHEGAGATFALTWSSSITANRVVLFDRPNLNDQVTSGYIKFSDQSTVTIPTLANDGSATTIDFADKTFSSAVLYITGVTNTTSNVGLAEFQVFYVANRVVTSSSSATAPSSTAASPASSSAASSSATALPSDATRSAAPAATSTRATIVFSSAASSTAAASSASAAAPLSSSTAAPTSSSTSPAATGLVNFARQVQAISASTAATATSQTADKAVDGVVNGYKEDGSGDYTKEWATDHQGAGAWLQLTWSSPVTLNQVALFDRLNLNDFVTNATLGFSDGSVVSMGSLNNAGAAVYVNFTARATTSLRFTVVSVSSATSSAGLAELQAFNNPSAQIPAPSSVSPVAAASPSTSSRVSIDLNASTATAAASSAPATTSASAPLPTSSAPTSPSSSVSSASPSTPSA
ncbi:hypothetical protein JCM8208_003245 [Rhodotorula glutinis]